MASKPASTKLPPEAESIFSRALVGPILFVSFIFSLFLVDKQTSAGIFESSTRSDPKNESQHYYHSNRRKLARREIDDAFVLRPRVIAALCVAGGVSVAGLGWCLSKAWAVWGYHQPPSATLA